MSNCQRIRRQLCSRSPVEDVSSEHSGDRDRCHGRGSSGRRRGGELRRRERGDGEVRQRGGRGGGRGRGGVQQRGRRPGSRGAGRSEQDIVREEGPRRLHRARPEASAQDQLQLRRAPGRRVPPRDQGAVGQVQRPWHRDDHHENWQADVPDVPGVVQRIKVRGQVRGADGHRSGGQQAIPIRVPQKLLAGGGQSGSSGAGAPLRAPGLAVHRGPATKAGGLVREGQADEQRHGQARPDRAELDAPISAQDTLGPLPAVGRQQSPHNRSPEGRAQNLYIPGGYFHRGHRLSESADNQAEDRQQPVRQRFPRLVQAHGFRSRSDGADGAAVGEVRRGAGQAVRASRYVVGSSARRSAAAVAAAVAAREFAARAAPVDHAVHRPAVRGCRADAPRNQIRHGLHVPVPSDRGHRTISLSRCSALALAADTRRDDLSKILTPHSHRSLPQVHPVSSPGQHTSAAQGSPCHPQLALPLDRSPLITTRCRRRPVFSPETAARRRTTICPIAHLFQGCPTASRGTCDPAKEECGARFRSNEQQPRGVLGSADRPDRRLRRRRSTRVIAGRAGAR